MKIAILSNGAQSLLNFRGHLLREMVQAGHEVVAFAPDYDATTRREMLELGASPQHFPMARSGIGLARELYSVVKLSRLLRQHKPEICCAHFIKPVIYGTIAAWLAGIKCRYGLIEGLGFTFTDGTEGRRKRKLLQIIITLLARFAFKRIDLLMFQNPDDLNEFVTRRIIRPEKTALAGASGVDLEEWSQCELPKGPVTFLLAARLLRDKGVWDYVEAARILRTMGLETRFLLLGSIDDNPASFTEAEVEEWVAAGIVEWPGHVRMKPWLAQAHVFVLPSYREGLPRSTQEAMAMGRAVITTDRPGCRETVDDGVNGYLVPVRDPKSLAAAMQRLVENPDEIEAMGEESRRMAEERFNVHLLNKRLLAFMELI
ncbi:glycosyltransferase family 4 protein [Croceibacterium sp. LX-88]|uniref:Glycosyltransferase family 4 protein n=1 Tax=Croceibacterium selenioxidans TaxID=2838833 RepID=A0ABS5W389_9SPHN|nr:glycosyltransferase family 4 protein [Croceibacterium selenioxidans]MBT2133572.1 glycosyltransferase family 4 protein [Croceibacterium selenioxidans]